MNNNEYKSCKLSRLWPQNQEIRQEVFIKEQNVPENIEIDGLDSKAKHVLVFDGEKVIGTGIDHIKMKKKL